MTSGDDAKAKAAESIEGLRDELLGASHEIHAHPELAYEEEHASALLSDALEAGGLRTERGLGDIATAFRATAGSSGPHFVICAEYDALPKIGHACGHNIIASAALGAGLALAPLADDLGFTVSVLGTPAEEAGGGKEELIKAGAFDGVDAAMMVHPAPVDITEPPMLAVAAVSIKYIGKESHASAFPERGINALDAMHVAYTAVSCLRQHIAPTDRIHGIETKGGDAPNVVPALTRAVYNIRSRTAGELEALIQRVRECFEAGAVATRSELSFKLIGNTYNEVRHNMVMADAYRENAIALGRTPLPRDLVDPRFAGSTDMGNVSYKVPTIHPMIGIASLPAVNHQPEFAEHCVTPAADQAVTDGATAMAWTIIDLATRGDLLAEATDAFRAGTR